MNGVRSPPLWRRANWCTTGPSPLNHRTTLTVAQRPETRSADHRWSYSGHFRIRMRWKVARSCRVAGRAVAIAGEARQMSAATVASGSSG
jgi:hypothetical protein